LSCPRCCTPLNCAPNCSPALEVDFRSVATLQPAKENAKQALVEIRENRFSINLNRYKSLLSTTRLKKSYKKENA
jgi:hypothetical protein